MDMINFNYKKAIGFFSQDDIDSMQKSVNDAHSMLHNRNGLGNEYLGWMDLPRDYDKSEFEKIKKCSKKIQSDSDVLLVIGIGGSYLGARAAINMLGHTFSNELDKDVRKSPKVYFVGNNLSSTYINDILDLIDQKDISINVISKSGTTTEPALAFRIFREYVENKYGKEEANNRIYVTTDKEKGALRKMAENEGYETFVIPDDVGGRYSVLTAVGLLPICASGFDIDKIMEGANDARVKFETPDIKSNDCYQYAVVRNILNNSGKDVELLVNYEPQLHYISEWWKQLFGESEGKDHKGLFPASVNYSTDLHSIGQYIQDGKRIIFETVLNVENTKRELEIPYDEENLDGLNFLAGKNLDFVNFKSYQGTILAHNDGGVPNLIINIPNMDEYNFGYLVYFFEKACAISGYLLGINPFDQPGVEEYKNNMFALSGKPGYESHKEKLENRL
ncbi:glucose-6-phosphate isomerase [Metaclostridioides mangenotii]|uniref:glucose-6-phosphate isomerase n=1 Tax=Metaclostridioides mangenotii TaxID=1540 RepID=UPI0028EFF4EE|nr:glucose-6-phosphate isomerase [Clostridioides mangenotii]